MSLNHSNFVFYDGISPISYLVSEDDFEGVKKITSVHTEDVEAVIGTQPTLHILRKEDSVPNACTHAVIIGTLGVSSLLHSVASTHPDILEGLSGKREVYRITTVTNPVPGVTDALVIAGSDKRGTIYGIFHLSELFGVSPWIWWADVKPAKQNSLSLPLTLFPIVSKEPSVRYRGFFINDEWPSFGSWTTKLFGDFNAKMYDKLFQLLLRLKGNYLWPAMWSASFPLDGPGLGNLELADLYGIVMGESHHEPCCRASEEWDKVRGTDTVYGNEWNFYTNREGLLRYWDEALERNSKYETMITIGMRGERDSSMLGDHSSLQENIDLLKDIITEQNKLIRKNVNEDLSQVSRLLALYKEVESYYYGNETAKGLIDFEELDGVTIMLCEDNYGNMRTLPPEHLRNRKGGWGMYYHFDYHGGPISYEWVNSTPLAKVWEQMSMAYDYGIRDVWIVNVGDLKPQELPLSYFMDLAYDFDTYGTSAPNTTHDYTMNWVRRQFPFADGEGLTESLTSILEGYTRINGMRRPEAMNQEVYSTDRGNEAELMLRRCDELIERTQKIAPRIPFEYQDAFYQLVQFPAEASMNVQRMNLLAALSIQRAKEHSSMANVYADAVKEAITTDLALTKHYNEDISGGKWNGMMSSKHIGFQSWNDERWYYPITANYTPVTGARLLVYPVAPDHYPKTLRPLTLPPFIYVRELGSSASFRAANQPDTACIRLVNAGKEEFPYTIHCDAEWLAIDQPSATLAQEICCSLTIDSTRLTKAYQSCLAKTASNDLTTHTDYKQAELVTALRIEGAGSTVILPVTVQCYELNGQPEEIDCLTILRGGCAIIPASCYQEHFNGINGSEWKVLKDYGFAQDSVKVYPTTETFETFEDAPRLHYPIFVPEEGDYTLSFRVAPSNHLTAKVRLAFLLSLNDQEVIEIDTLPDGFISGSYWSGPWCASVLDNYRLVHCKLHFTAGRNHLCIAGKDAGFVLQEIIIH